MERLLGWIYKGFYRFSKGYLNGADTEPQWKETAAHQLVSCSGTNFKELGIPKCYSVKALLLAS